MIKAIPTFYNGFQFRSRLEARWAVFFDTLGVEYEYEKQGYDLGDGVYYLPDFWIPHLRTWFEVKGKKPSSIEIEKALRLSSDEFPVVIAHGSVGEQSMRVFLTSLKAGGGGSSNGECAFDRCSYCHRLTVLWLPWYNDYVCDANFDEIVGCGCHPDNLDRYHREGPDINWLSWGYYRAQRARW